MTQPTNEQVLAVLRTVVEPELKKDIVALTFVRNVKVEGAEVSLMLELPQPSAKHREVLEKQCRELLLRLPGIKEAKIKVGLKVGMVQAEQKSALADVEHLVAVASGKGGVGKSTVAVNLALALKAQGKRVGLLDTDIYGPSIPIMLGTMGQPQQKGDRILPLEAYGVKLMSIGFLAGAEAPVIWRGPMVHGLIRQFLTDVDWGELDYLVVDMPPGTGDAALTLTQMAPLSGAVIVTTANDLSLIDARKGLEMFRKVNIPVLGIVENMSFFTPPDLPDRKYYIFGKGGGKRIAQELDVDFLGEIPIDPRVVEQGDRGYPILLSHPDSPAAQAFESLAAQVTRKLARIEGEQPGVAIN